MQDDSPNNQSSRPQSKSGVELVGKSAQDRHQEKATSKGSFLRRYFGLNSSKKSESKSQEEKLQPNVAEQFLLSWQAPEFVQTHKPIGWYLGFVFFFLVLIGLAIWTQQYLTVGLFAVMAVALLMYANRPPRVLNYQVSNYGVYVGDKKYLFDNFDSYYEANDYGQTVIELVPNKRFGTLVSLPPAEHHLEELEHTLSQMLPKVENKEDLVDKVFRKLRF